MPYFSVSEDKDHAAEEKKEVFQFIDEPISVQNVLITAATEQLEVPSPITFEDFVLEQASEAFFKIIREKLEDYKPINFRENLETGVLECVQPNNFASVIYNALQPRFFTLRLYQKMQVIQKEDKLYQTIRRIITHQISLLFVTRWFDHVRLVRKKNLSSS